VKQQNTTIGIEELQELLRGDDKSLSVYFKSVTKPADLKEFFEKTELEEWPRLLKLITDPEKRAELVSQFEDPQLEKLKNQLKPKEIANLAKQMESDDAADLIGSLSDLEQIEALERLPLEERKQVQELLRYPEDSAGGIMQLEKAQVLESATVIDAIAKVRELVENDVEVLMVWVVDKQNRLVGHVALVDLLLNKSTTCVEKIMDADLVTVKPLLDQEEVAQLFKKYDLITLPVIDDKHHLLGRIVIDDVVDVLTKEAEEDALHMGGTSTEELAHQEDVLQTACIRLPWLSVAFLSSLISAFLIHTFEAVFKQAPYLFTIVPVISAMGGSIGLQSATILMRGLTSGKTSYQNLPRILFKEARVGLLVGLLIGLCAAFVAAFILQPENYLFGFVVFISMVLAMFAATSLGVVAPSILNRLGVDPAIASGPFLQTTLDITGILIFLGTASMFLKQLN